MRAQQKQGGPRILLAGKLGKQIYEVDLPPWSVVTECLTRYLPAETPKLILDVISGFFDSRRSSRARPEINKPLNMSEGFLAGEFFPNLWRSTLCH